MLQKLAKYHTKIGLEIHALLSTREKLFSPARVPKLDDNPNVNLGYFDIALPGSLPVLNRDAVHKALKASLALNCSVNLESRFDRKHYFYHDQPNGYQITQKFRPLATNGFVNLYKRDGRIKKDLRVEIEHVQLEQDTASSHYDGDDVHIDFNRAGSPLIEIVTPPVIPSADAAGALLAKIQSILVQVNASEAQLEAGGLRCDVNVSVHDQDDGKRLGRSEVKNLASVRNVVLACESEERRMNAMLNSGYQIRFETRGFDNSTGETYFARVKETTNDYRYMSDPELGPLRLSAQLIEHLKRTMEMLSDEKYTILSHAPYQLREKSIEALLSAPGAFELFMHCSDIIFKAEPDDRAKQLFQPLANWITQELYQILGKSDVKITESALHADDLVDLIRKVNGGQIDRAAAKTILTKKVVGDPRGVAHIIQQEGLEVSSSSDLVDSAVRSVLESHPNEAESYKQGNERILRFLLGMVMRSHRGKLNSKDAQKKLLEHLDRT